ncbi:MAG TPA: Wzz/FepE/Etk N-terminal domain-containing protein, partial [Candidatus Methylomirabilis sp.]|nr:Wzz/FepE/Etk N-terminal domain-containing protein [Candidatus Methylomirabilis sp.]
MAQYEINLRDYWRIVRRRKAIVIAVPLAFAAFSALVAELQRPHPIFLAVASVRVEKASSLTGLLLEAITISSGDNLATQAALIKSFPVMERAAKKLGRLPPDLTAREIRSTPRHLLVLTELQERVKAEQEGSTNIINITASAADAEQAARTANEVAEAFREENIATRTKQVREARLFIEEQLGEVGARLRDSEEELKALKERGRFIALPEDAGAALKQLVTLQLEREALLVDLLPAHPQVRALESRIEGVRRVLERHQRELPETALQLARLQREVKVHEDLYALLKGKHQEALIREREQVEEVSIVRPAT